MVSLKETVVLDQSLPTKFFSEHQLDYVVSPKYLKNLHQVGVNTRRVTYDYFGKNKLSHQKLDHLLAE